MPGAPRQFEPQITRSGGTPAQYRFCVRCSQCAKTDTVEARQPLGDEVVKSSFKERGWLLGRTRAFDLCSACLAQPQRTVPPRSKGAMAGSRSAASPPAREQRHRDTADILARHLGKPEALAAEVFRPKAVEPPRPSAPEAVARPAAGPFLSPQVDQVLTGMAADLKSLTATVERLAEQVGQVLAQGAQQIDAIACLAPLMSQSAQAIVSGIQDLAGAVHVAPGSSPLPLDATESQKPQTGQEAAHPEPAPETGPVLEPGPVALRERGRRGRPKEQAQEPPRAAAGQVVVKSIADPKRSDRFYTSIRLPRKLWDDAGFGSEDRLLLAWSGRTLTISRVGEGGVKPKAIGATAVILQSWKLGRLNFDQPKITSGETLLRLTAPRSAA